MPLSHSLFGNPLIEVDESADVEHEVAGPTLALGDELGPPAPEPVALQAIHIDENDNAPPVAPEMEAPAAVQHIASASLAEPTAEGVAAAQATVGHLAVPLYPAFSLSPSEGTTIVPSTMSLSRLTTYQGEGGSIGLDPTEIKRARGRSSSLFSSTARIVRRALERVFRLDK